MAKKNEIKIKVVFADASEIDPATRVRLEAHRRMLAGGLLELGKSIIEQGAHA